jgi:hypothetical protein
MVSSKCGASQAWNGRRKLFGWEFTTHPASRWGGDRRSFSAPVIQGMLDFEPMSANNPFRIMSEDTREFGPQPLVAVMEKWDLESHHLIDVSEEQLTYKQVQRARSGRKLTLKMMMKVARTLNLAIWSKLDAGQRGQFVEYLHKDLFSYSKGFDPDKGDANQHLFPN